MKCMRCGKELELVRELTEDEKNSFDYINSKEQIANEALSSDIIRDLTLEDSKIVDYMNAAFEHKLEAAVLRRKMFREIAKETENFDIIDYKIYTHTEE